MKHIFRTVPPVFAGMLLLTACSSPSDELLVLPQPGSYTVGGTASGLTAKIILQNNSGDDLTVEADNNFTFATALSDNAAYAVTVKDDGVQDCTLTNASGTVTGAAVSNVGVSCALKPMALVSVGTNGMDASQGAATPSVSADGRYVAFVSNSENLVTGDMNARSDVFVRDRQTGETTRVSVAVDGTEGDDHSYHASISADGRYVAFYSYATNLVANDLNARSDIFVRDRQTGETTRVSVADDGTEGDASSGSVAGTGGLAISADGRYVAFVSYATNLVTSDLNGQPDIFVYDREARTTTLVSKASDGTQADNVSKSPTISADGRYVAFASDATNLVASDANGLGDIFVHELQSVTTTRVSLPDAASASPSISADGRYVAYVNASLGGSVLIADREGETVTVGFGSRPSISADGRFVALFTTSRLVEGDTNDLQDVYVYDRQTAETRLISVAADGTQADKSSTSAAISGDGRYVAFVSSATNLVTDGITYPFEDVFVAPTR